MIRYRYNYLTTSSLVLRPPVVLLLPGQFLCSNSSFPLRRWFIVQVIFYFLIHSGYFENRIPLKPALETYAASQTTLLHIKRLSNRVSDFCYFVCSLFPKATLFYFYSYVTSNHLGIRPV